MKLTDGVYQVSGHICGMNSNVYVLDTEDGLVFIDAGFAGKQYEMIQDYLKDWNVDQKEIKAVLLTHAHVDHAGNAWRFQENGAALYAGTKDAKAIEEAGESVLEKLFGSKFHPCKDVHGVTDGDVLQFGRFRITVLDLPGHTAGAVGYLVENGKKKVLFVGDMFTVEDVSPADEMLPKIGFNGSPDYSAEANLKSFERLKSCEVDIVAPGHRGVYFGDCKALFDQLYEIAQD